MKVKHIHKLQFSNNNCASFSYSFVSGHAWTVGHVSYHEDPYTVKRLHEKDELFRFSWVKMSYRREVESLFGKECMNKLLNHVRRGKMSDDQMRDFVEQLPPSSPR